MDHSHRGRPRARTAVPAPARISEKPSPPAATALPALATTALPTLATHAAARGVASPTLLLLVSVVRDAYENSRVGPLAAADKGGAAHEAYVQRMHSLRTRARDDAATAHRGWLRQRQGGLDDEEISWLLADKTRGAAKLPQALKSLLGALLTSAAACVVGREVAAPH